jgi:predicted nucleotidyltransferase
MEKVIDNIVREIISDVSWCDNRLVGIILFGSYASKNANIDSDIDLRVICHDVEPKFMNKQINGMRVDIHVTSLTAIINAISHEIDWVVGEIRDCTILYDPNNIINSLKTICNNFHFSPESIAEDIRLAKESLESAIDLTKVDDLDGAYFCFVYSSEKIIRALLKKKNVFYKGPKYLMKQLRDSTPSEAKTFKSIVIRDFKKSDLKNILNLLDELIRKIDHLEYNK